MKLVAYCVFDSAAGAYARPFFVQNDAVAVRTFKDICGDESHPVGAHPEHYSLVRVGQFDDGKGQFLPEDRETIMTGLEAVASMNNRPEQAEFLGSAGGTA